MNWLNRAGLYIAPVGQLRQFLSVRLKFGDFPNLKVFWTRTPTVTR